MTQEDEKKGIYKYQFFTHGEWVPIVIDDKLPTRSNGARLRYIHPGYENGNAYWASLMEKAYAKLHVNYSPQLRGGTNAESLYTLTGMPFQRYSTTKIKPDDLYKIIEKADQNKYIISGACFCSKGGKKNKFHNIVTGHAYTILGAHTFKDG